MRFAVRDARPEDAPRVAEWTQDTFSWGDYVGESVAEWIEDGSRHVLVAVDERDVPVAMAAVRMLSSKEGWLSAARVRSDFRRQGLGSLLNDACVDWVRGRGGKVARLAIEDDNSAAISQVDKLSYRLESTWVRATVDTSSVVVTGREETVSPASRADVDPAWMYWSTSELFESGRGLIPSEWTWRRGVVGDLQAAAEQRRFYQSPAGWVIFDFSDDGEIEVVWMASSPSDFPRLLAGVGSFASQRSEPRVTCVVPETGWSGEAMRRAGAIASEYLVFAKPV